MPQNQQLLNEVAALYNWLDRQTRRYYKPEILCSACGNCCNFNQFEHLLFVTGPELLYLAGKLNAKLKQMSGDTCPYNTAGKCTVYGYRFSGCRIYNCKADKDFQAFLSESAVKKLKSICQRFDIPYKYTDLKTALDKFNG
jgi:hypothetical protein